MVPRKYIFIFMDAIFGSLTKVFTTGCFIALYQMLHGRSNLKIKLIKLVKINFQMMPF